MSIHFNRPKTLHTLFFFVLFMLLLFIYVFAYLDFCLKEDPTLHIFLEMIIAVYQIEKYSAKLHNKREKKKDGNKKST